MYVKQVNYLRKFYIRTHLSISFFVENPVTTFDNVIVSESGIYYGQTGL